eukprot:922653-Pleurochrysis_carterae.AAC.1
MYLVGDTCGGQAPNSESRGATQAGKRVLQLSSGQQNEIGASIQEGGLLARKRKLATKLNHIDIYCAGAEAYTRWIIIYFLVYEKLIPGRARACVTNR